MSTDYAREFRSDFRRAVADQQMVRLVLKCAHHDEVLIEGATAAFMRCPVAECPTLITVETETAEAPK